jgi:hypothetical protein
MDRTAPSEGADAGSIPAESTKRSVGSQGAHVRVRNRTPERDPYVSYGSEAVANPSPTVGEDERCGRLLPRVVATYIIAAICTKTLVKATLIISAAPTKKAIDPIKVNKLLFIEFTIANIR